MRAQRRHGFRALHFAGRHAVRPERNAGMIDAGTQHARQFQRPGVDVHDVTAGMHDADRPRRRDPVEILPRHAPVVEVDGIERPSRQRLLRIGQRGIGLAQTSNDFLDRLHAGPDHTVGIGAIEVSAIDEPPLHALGHMAVALHQTRHQDLVRKASIELVFAPSGQFVEAAGAEDRAVAHRDMGRERPARIHRDDFAGLVDGGHGINPRQATKVVPAPSTVKRPARRQ